MDNTIVSALIAVVAVVAVGLLARRIGSKPHAGPLGGDSAGRSPSEPGASLEERLEADRTDIRGAFEDDDSGEDEEAAVAIASDGVAFIAGSHSVRLVPPAEGEDPWEQGAASRERDRGARAISMSLHAGDYRGGRVSRGSAGIDPWRLEVLGRDGEYIVWSFETQEGAAAALALLEAKKIIRPGRDEDGRPAPPSSEAFEEARRAFEETEQELAMDNDAPDDGDRRG